MKPYEISATVAEHGALQLGGLPFAAGTRVAVCISQKDVLAHSKQAPYDELDEVHKECAKQDWDAHGRSGQTPDAAKRSPVP